MWCAEQLVLIRPASSLSQGGFCFSHSRPCMGMGNSGGALPWQHKPLRRVVLVSRAAFDLHHLSGWWLYHCLLCCWGLPKSALKSQPQGRPLATPFHPPFHLRGHCLELHFTRRCHLKASKPKLSPVCPGFTLWLPHQATPAVHPAAITRQAR